MKTFVPAACVTLLLLIGACAGQTDRFYTLRIQPEGPLGPRTASSTRILLNVTLPTLVDRPELIINTSRDAIAVLEHERWAAPLGEQVAQTLARDLERRRADLLVGSSSFEQAFGSRFTINVEVVQMSVQKGGRAILEAHWRMVDALRQTDQIGGEAFSAALGGDGYAAVARAFSDCLAALADRLAAQLPAR